MFESLVDYGNKNIKHFAKMLGIASERKSKHYEHFYKTFLDQWTGYVRGVEAAQKVFAVEKMKPCKFCLNAAVDKELTAENDLSYSGVGKEFEPGSKIHAYIRSGDAKPTALVISQYMDRYNRNVDVIEYKMKFCPECGRPLFENKINNE